jgi:two-component system sensor histidine kinase DesK
MRLLPRGTGLGFTPYVWLAYLGFVLVHPVLSRAGPAEWIATIAAICVFLPLYFAAFWLEGRRLLWDVAAMALLASIFAPINPSASAFFVYAAGFIGDAATSRRAFLYLAALLAWIGLVAWGFGLRAESWMIAVGISAVVGAVNIHFGEQRRQESRLRVAENEIARLAAVAERERIARDLHDLLGHTLSLIVLKSELASRLVERDVPRAIAEIRDVERVSREALAQVREAVRGYRASSLEDEERSARQALQAAGVAVNVEGTGLALAPAQEAVLAMALREAATNVVRHAGATCCRIRLRRVDGYVELEVADNGSGGEAKEGAGLAGMRERVSSLGGTVSRDGAHGTTLVVRLPA